MGWKKMASLPFFAVVGILVWILRGMIMLVISGATEQSLWLLVGGGILLYLFVGLIVVGVIIFGGIGLMILFD